MALVAGKGGGNSRVEQDNIEAGTYPGRLVQIIDLGLQPQRAFKGQDKPPAHELMVTYELVDEFMKDEKGEALTDKPRWISESFPLYSLDQDKAKSTQRYNAFDPNGVHGGDWGKLIESPVGVLIVNNPGNNGKVYDNVASLSALRPKDAEKCPKLVNPTKVFDLDNPDLEVFNKLPKWIQEKITGNLNYNGSKLQKMLGNNKQAAKPEDEGKQEAEAQAEDSDNPY